MGRFARGKGGGKYGQCVQKSGGTGGVVARPGFGECPRHQAAVAPDLMSAAKAFSIAVGVIRLSDQLVGKVGALIRRAGGKPCRRLGQIAKQAFAHPRALP